VALCSFVPFDGVLSRVEESMRDIVKDFAISIPQPVSAFQSAEMRNALEEIAEARSAEGFVARIMREVAAFEAALDSAYEVGVSLVSFGQTFTFYVTGIGFIEPSLITFRGLTDAKDPVQLVQHVNQISFLLMKVKRLEPEKPKTPIGFSFG
jgi:hypothetical protein